MNSASSLAELCDQRGFREVTVACGVFDGVHRGHQTIVAELLRLVDRTSAHPVIMTFEPHPRKILQPNSAPRLLTVREQKLRLLRGCGVADSVILPFSPEMASLQPRDFLARHLCPAGIDLRGVCVGEEWRFGAGGSGDTALLQRFGARMGFEVVSVPPFCVQGHPVSSTRIRNAICKGQLDTAELLLGRSYSVYGQIVRGKGVGSDLLHCPTANVADRDILLPPSGVYAARAYLREERVDARAGIAYIGTAPTVPRDDQGGVSASRMLELHVFDFHDSLYGRCIEVEFSAFIRADRKFDSMDELREQIEKDIREVKHMQAGSNGKPKTENGKGEAQGER